MTLGKSTIVPTLVVPRGRLLAALAALFLLAATVHAQESFRASIAGEEAAEQQKREQANAKYNLKLGPLKLRFGADLSVEASDNVDRLENTRTADISTRPSFDVTAMLPVTDRHTFIVNFGAGYAKYLRSRKLDHIFITPNSTLSYDMYAGDAVINLHSRFTYSEEDYQQFEISRTADTTLPGNGYFKNTSGAKVQYDLGKYLFILNLDHEIYQATKTNFDYQNHSSELVSVTAVYGLNEVTRFGLQGGGGLTAYDLQHRVQTFTNVVYDSNQVPTGTNVTTGFNTALSDQVFVNLGPVLIYQPSKHVKTVLYAGYTIYQPQGQTVYPFGGKNYYLTNKSSAAFYADFRLDHELNKVLTYTVDIGRQLRLGSDTDTSEVIYATLDLNWNFIRKVDLRTPLRYQRETKGDRLKITTDSWQAGFTAGYQLTESAYLSATYQYTLLQSSLAGNSYYQNQLVLDLRYTF